MPIRALKWCAQLLAFLAAASEAVASQQVTRGDAEAILQASLNGGVAIRLHGGEIVGAPADSSALDSLARISPFVPSRHYCSLDWHVISLSVFTGSDTLSPAQIIEELTSVTTTFEFDGVTLDASQLAPRGMVAPPFDWDIAFFVQTGLVLAPEDIAVGEHTLVTTTLFPSDAPTTVTTTFFMDAPGTGVCRPDNALIFREVK